jgi:hypothetical protein
VVVIAYGDIARDSCASTGERNRQKWVDTGASPTEKVVSVAGLTRGSYHFVNVRREGAEGGESRAIFRPQIDPIFDIDRTISSKSIESKPSPSQTKAQRATT